jgi:hypothetical protein
MHIKPLIFATILLAPPFVIPAPVARACSCGPWAIAGSVPENGARDVPINQALVVEGRLIAESIKLEDMNGNPVAFDLEQGPTPGCPGTWAELLPRAPLAPMTQYRIVVASDAPFVIDPDRDSLTFTTGTQVLPEQNLTPPKGRASVVEGLPQSDSSCGPTVVAACVDLEDYAGVELVARRAGQIITRWLFSEDSLDPLFGFDVVPDCLEFRRRAVTGQRSESLTICGEALGTRSAVASDMSLQVVLCRAGVIGEQASNAPDAGRPKQEEDAGGDVRESETIDAADAELSSDGCAAGRHGQAPGAALWLIALVAAGRASRRAGRFKRY